MFDWESNTDFISKIDEIKFKTLFNKNVSSIIKTLLFTRFCENIFADSTLRNYFFVTICSVLSSILYFDKIWLYIFAVFYNFTFLIIINLTILCVIINSVVLIVLIVILFLWIINCFLIFIVFFADLIFFALLLLFNSFKICFCVELRICCFILIRGVFERLIIFENIFAVFRPWFININSSKFVVLTNIVINKALIMVEIIEIVRVRVIGIATDFFIFLIILNFIITAGFFDNINIFVPEV